MRTSLVTLLCIITLLASSVKADLHAAAIGYKDSADVDDSVKFIPVN